MEHDNRNIDPEMEEEEDFEALLNQSMLKPVRLNPGEKVEATISHITETWVFLDLGGKSEGSIAIAEFMDDDGAVTVHEGDTVTAYFLSSKNHEMLFTTKLAGGTAVNAHLEDAYRSGIPIEGFVEKEVKGGFEVKVAGNIRAFCPYSQMGLRRTENPDQFVGRHVVFKITEYGEKGSNIIVSNRAVLEEERQQQKDALRDSLKEGARVKGEITAIKKFGAFVDIGGIEGLIPISEISWGRVEDIDSVLTVGQTVEVAVKKLDWEEDTFSFSLKEVMPDPWKNVGQRYPEGSHHQGTVSRLAQFGAFVTLEPGVDGLIHISELGKGKRINHPREMVEENQTITVTISKVDEENKRLSLALPSGDQSGEDNDDSFREHLTVTTGKSSGSSATLGDILKAKMAKKKKS